MTERLPNYLKPISYESASSKFNLGALRGKKMRRLALAGLFLVSIVKNLDLNNLFKSSRQATEVQITIDPQEVQKLSQKEHITAKRALELLHRQNESKVAGLSMRYALQNFWNDLTLNNYATLETDNKSRAQWAYDRFMQKATRLNGRLKEYVAELFVGLLAQESKYYDGAESSKGALGVAQIMPGTYNDLKARRAGHFSFELPDDPKEILFKFKPSIDLATVHIDTVIYPTLKKPLSLIRQILDMSEDDFYKFSAFAIINAYNAGQGTIRTCLIKFAQFLQRQKEEYAKNPNGKNAFYWKYLKTSGPLELYFVFARYSYKNKSHNLYGQDALNYTFLAMGGSNALMLKSVFVKNKGAHEFEQAEKSQDPIGYLIRQANANVPWWLAKYGVGGANKNELEQTFARFASAK